MKSVVDRANGCRPAAYVLGKTSVVCNDCPFPFCVITEAKIIKAELGEHLAMILRRLGNTMEETAEAMGVSLRSVYRYSSVHKDTDCIQCNLIHSQDVMCKSDIYTVVCKDGQHVIMLNRHRCATERELKVIEYFIDYVFPNSIVGRVDGGHDHWVLGRVSLEEAKKFDCMCNALGKYVLSLGEHNQARAARTVKSTVGLRKCLTTDRDSIEW